MINYNKKRELSSIEKARYVYSLIDLARKYSDNKDKGSDQLASALIYVNIAEFLAYNILLDIRKKIIGQLGGYKYKLAKKDKEHFEVKMNLGDLLKLLKDYEFPTKEKLIGNLSNIKGNRDLLFHNIVELPEKGVIPASLIKSIQTQVETFLKEWSLIIRDK